jgi:hypothetical protein
MATYLELYRRQYADPDFANRVTVAITQNARFILTAETGHPNEANRRAWATEAIINPAATLSLIMVWVVVDPAIADHDEVSDETINAVVGAAIDPIANAFGSR